MADFEDLVSDREELPFCQFDVDDDGSIPYGSLNPIAPFVCSPNVCFTLIYGLMIKYQKAIETLAP